MDGGDSELALDFGLESKVVGEFGWRSLFHPLGEVVTAVVVRLLAGFHLFRRMLVSQDSLEFSEKVEWKSCLQSES